VDPFVGGNRDIWAIDLDRGVSNRLTVDPAEDLVPEWSPDGKQIVFASRRGKNFLSMFLRSAISVGGDDPLLPNVDPELVDVPMYWSTDGKYIVFVRVSSKDSSTYDIWLKPTFGDGKPFPYVESKSFIKGHPRLSADGRWLAYT